ncbi:unnamed protein product [Rotaria sordida]|uniref:Uncharacterized protein n=1 Tax=Rotaria sordida TaxID=392033 RepID=A0A819I1C0_9BILA|nr:unnamed protein product [Rotaria sordida]CAF1169601.1 unnamed protein product [Rotaria sordida]CAF3909159.1 unnamed protein product [Rotaria sordida]
MQLITILSCLILAVTILSVQMRPHGGQYDRRPPFGNGTFHFSGTFAPSRNHTDHQHNGFRPQHGHEDGSDFRPQRGHEDGSDFRPGKHGGGGHP